jgi:hypothetical protein
MKKHWRVWEIYFQNWSDSADPIYLFIYLITQFICLQTMEKRGSSKHEDLCQSCKNWKHAQQVNQPKMATVTKHRLILFSKWHNIIPSNSCIWPSHNLVTPSQKISITTSLSAVSGYARSKKAQCLIHHTATQEFPSYFLKIRWKNCWKLNILHQCTIS